MVLRVFVNVTGGNQTDSVVAFGRKGRRFECAQCHSNSPLGNRLLGNAPPLEMIYTVIELVKEVTKK